jgi:shikimate dehydrogenase
MSQNFAVIGHPLEHSVSPQIHTKLFALTNTDANYRAIEILPEKLAVFVPQLSKLDGFNITIPYKQKIIPFLASIDAKSAKYGAVNTVKCIDGLMTGYNTDAAGFLRALKLARIPLRGNVLLLGAGGVSRVMAYESIDRCCSLTIASQRKESAESLANELKKFYPESQITGIKIDEIEGKFDVLLNGTPVGMYPKVDDCPISEKIINKIPYVYDAIFNPLKTKLLSAALANGAIADSGLSMLVWQAAVAQEIWLGSKFDPKDIGDIIVSISEILKQM